MTQGKQIDLDAIERTGGNASRAHVLELVRRLRKAERDVARYRFLRTTAGRHAALWGRLLELSCTDELMDRAIDDAMRGKESSGSGTDAWKCDGDPKCAK